jgi:hypothetical protein
LLAADDAEYLLGWRKTVAAAKHSEARLTEQPLGGATDGKQLRFQPADEKSQPWLEIPFRVEKEPIGWLLLRACHAADYGTYRILLDGKEIGKVDFYSPALQLGEEKLGWREISPGEHTMRFEFAGKNAAWKGILLGIDSLVMESPIYSRSSKIDLRTLQKK